MVTPLAAAKSAKDRGAAWRALDQNGGGVFGGFGQLSVLIELHLMEPVAELIILQSNGFNASTFAAEIIVGFFQLMQKADGFAPPMVDIAPMFKISVRLLAADSAAVRRCRSVHQPPRGRSHGLSCSRHAGRSLHPGRPVRKERLPDPAPP